MTGSMPSVERRILAIRGVVQGVGFRPFVYRQARALGLCGWVRNESDHVSVDIEGPGSLLDEFERRLEVDAPGPESPPRLERHSAAPRGLDRFEIQSSLAGRSGADVLAPDQATCAACRAEVHAASGRRSGYAFTSCTRCGPRFTIASALPFDRETTSMRDFVMCARCQNEYDDPSDRRFHAQTNACPDCGPQVRWCDGRGLETGEEPVLTCAGILEAGGVVALHGIGGFQLVADALDDAAVSRLRSIKRRPEKPLAVMYPSVAAVARDCVMSTGEATLLQSPAAPITLLQAKSDCLLASSVRRGVSAVGVMLPYSPLHCLVVEGLGRPVVVTSGNRGDDVILSDSNQVRREFSGLVDGFLVHDRRIEHPCDDSVSRVVAGRPTVLRRARGYAPSPIRLRRPVRPVLALGGHLKATVAIAVEREATLSPHIGNLDSIIVRRAYEREVERLLRTHDVTPEVVACDLHPDYYSSRFAASVGKPVVAVQHHEAHVASCAAEHGLCEPYLGVAWDGTGYGRDGSGWGSEFFVVTPGTFRRVGHLRPFRLPGGERASRDGRRAAYGMWAQLGRAACPADVGLTDLERQVFSQQIRKGVNAPWSTSAGRLFDAVAALIGLRTNSEYEGHAAVSLEDASVGGGASQVSGSSRSGASYSLDLDTREAIELDWRSLVDAIVGDVAAGTPRSTIGARFHAALVDGIVAVAREVGLRDVVLSGGVFQNALLVEGVTDRLARAGFLPWVHRLVPPNDGGIALGQAVIAARET